MFFVSYTEISTIVFVGEIIQILLPYASLYSFWFPNSKYRSKLRFPRTKNYKHLITNRHVIVIVIRLPSLDIKWYQSALIVRRVCETREDGWRRTALVNRTVRKKRESMTRGSGSSSPTRTKRRNLFTPVQLMPRAQPMINDSFSSQTTTGVIKHRKAIPIELDRVFVCCVFRRTYDNLQTVSCYWPFR